MIMVFNCSVELSKLRELSARIQAEKQYVMNQAAFEELRDEYVKIVIECDYMDQDEAFKAVAAATKELQDVANNSDPRYYCTLLALKQIMDEQVGDNTYFFSLPVLFIMMTQATLAGCRISGDIADYYNHNSLLFNISLPGTPHPDIPVTEGFISSVRKFINESDVTSVLSRLFESPYEGDVTGQTLDVPYFYLFPALSHDSDMLAYGHTTIRSAAKYAAAALCLDYTNVHEDTSNMEIAEHILCDKTFSVKDRVVCVESFERPWEVIQLLDTFGGYYVVRPFCSHADMLNGVIKKIFDEHTDLITFKRINLLGDKVLEEFEVQVLRAQDYLYDSVLEPYPNVKSIICLRHFMANRHEKSRYKARFSSYLSNIEFNRPNKPEKPIIACIASSLIQDSPLSMLDLAHLCYGRFRTAAFAPNHMCMDPFIYKLIHECIQYMRNTTPAEGLATHRRTKPEYKNLLAIIHHLPKVELLNELADQIVRHFDPENKEP